MSKIQKFTNLSVLVSTILSLIACGGEGFDSEVEDATEVRSYLNAVDNRARRIDCPSCLFVTENDSVQTRLTDNCPVASDWRYFALMRLDTWDLIRFRSHQQLDCNTLATIELRREIPPDWGEQPVVIVFKRGYRFRLSQNINIRARNTRGGGIIECPACESEVQSAFIETEMTTNCPAGSHWEVACLWRFSTGEIIAFKPGQPVTCDRLETYELAVEIPLDWGNDDIYVELMERTSGVFRGTQLFTVEN